MHHSVTSSRHFPYSVGLLPSKEHNLGRQTFLGCIKTAGASSSHLCQMAAFFILFLFVFLKNLTSDMTHPLSTNNHLNTSFQKVTNLGTVTLLEVSICTTQKNESTYTLRSVIFVSRKASTLLHISFRRLRQFFYSKSIYHR